MRFKSPFFLALCFIISSASAQKYTSGNTSEVKSSWDGISFSSQKTFQENIKDVPRLSYLAKIVSEEQISEALANEEMVTIFAPMDMVFTSMEEEKRDALLLNTSKVNNMIKFLSIPGRLDKKSITTAIDKNGGTAYFTTLSGETIGAKLLDGQVVLFDSEKNIATIAAVNFYHKNGFFHIISGLVYPSEE